MPDPSESKGSRPAPQCKAILLCDQTIVEEGTGKLSVIGSFVDFRLPRFPGLTKPFSVFMQLTDGIGRYQVTVELHDLQEDMVIATADSDEIHWHDRHTFVDLVLQIPPVPFRHAGAYDFVVFADGSEIDRRRFNVTEATSPEQQGESDE